MTNRLITILLLLASGPLFSQTKDFEFRNDYRPSFDQTISIEQLLNSQGTSKTTILDVRLAEDFAKDPILIPGAIYKNPEELSTWIAQLDKDKEVVVYCVAGKWVSQKVAHVLSQSGIRVQSLEGGIKAWKQYSKPQ
jgi:rhodanese-related sulfurtransferase